jgi:hypothetical protein
MARYLIGQMSKKFSVFLIPYTLRSTTSLLTRELRFTKGDLAALSDAGRAVNEISFRRTFGSWSEALKAAKLN